MIKATEVLKKLVQTGCCEMFRSIGDLDANTITLAFENLLDKIGMPSVLVEVAIDETEGIFVRFEDEDHDDVLVLFTFDEAGDPIASVVSEEDAQITIDLTALEPPTLEAGGVLFIDTMNLMWLNKTTLNLLLQAGKVGPEALASKGTPLETEEGVILGAKDTVTSEGKHVVMGKNKIRLPILITKEVMNATDKRRVKKAKTVGLL